jgi:hypothetical protein
MVFYLKLLVP